MIDADQEKLAFLKLELASAGKIVYNIKAQISAISTNAGHVVNDKKIAEHEKELKHWEGTVQVLLARVFEMEVLLGVEV